MPDPQRRESDAAVGAAVRSIKLEWVAALVSGIIAITIWVDTVQDQAALTLENAVAIEEVRATDMERFSEIERNKASVADLETVERRTENYRERYEALLADVAVLRERLAVLETVFNERTQ